MNWIEKPCEEIDAAIFSGDSLHHADQREMLKSYISRWSRAIDSHKDIDETKDD